jgi:hypothetical protein
MLKDLGLDPDWENHGFADQSTPISFADRAPAQQPAVPV